DHRNLNSLPTRRSSDLQINIERQQRYQRDDRNVVGRRHDLPQLFPIHGYFRASLISDSSTTGAGPEMPPSFLTRQKCTTMKIRRSEEHTSELQSPDHLV